MAAPLIRGEAAIGVLAVARPAGATRFSSPRWTCSALFATQAALALDLLRRSRQASQALAGAEDSPLARLQTAVGSISNDDRRAAADEVIEALSGCSGEPGAAGDPVRLAVPRTICPRLLRVTSADRLGRGQIARGGAS